MGLLEKFEQLMANAFEGTSERVFRQKMQPAQLGKALERAMASKQHASMGAKVVPNRYAVRLHPDDYKEFASYIDSLSRQMESWLAQVAQTRGFTLMNKLTVSISEDEKVARRRPAIEAMITDDVALVSARRAQMSPPGRPQRRRPGPRSHSRRDEPASWAAAPVHREEAPWQDAAGHTMPLQVVTPRQVTLEVVEGPLAGNQFQVSEGRSSVGRSSSNDIVLAVEDVSRHHAWIERDGSRLQVTDVGSTNGTRVNGEHVHIAELQDGDRLQMGSSAMVVSIPGGSGY